VIARKFLVSSTEPTLLQYVVDTTNSRRRMQIAFDLDALGCCCSLLATWFQHAVIAAAGTAGYIDTRPADNASYRQVY